MLRCAGRSHQARDREARGIRFGCYVPTRREVATQPPEWLNWVLTDWFWESPEELAPGNDQVQDALPILRARSDAHPVIQAIIADAPFSEHSDLCLIPRRREGICGSVGPGQQTPLYDPP